MIVRFVRWLKGLFRKRRFHIPFTPPRFEPEYFKSTKAYFDERQKAPHNRKRKPSKAMRHLYKL